MAIKDITVSQDSDRIINDAGQIVDTIDYWLVRWTEAQDGYINMDYRQDFMDEDEARAFARELEHR